MCPIPQIRDGYPYDEWPMVDQNEITNESGVRQEEEAHRSSRPYPVVVTGIACTFVQSVV
jgi:hypothetical protein